MDDQIDKEHIHNVLVLFFLFPFHFIILCSFLRRFSLSSLLPHFLVCSVCLPLYLNFILFCFSQFNLVPLSWVLSVQIFSTLVNSNLPTCYTLIFFLILLESGLCLVCNYSIVPFFVLFASFSFISSLFQ